MALDEEIKKLSRSLSGFGVDEQSLISTLGRWPREHRHSFRRDCSDIFKPSGHHHKFERLDTDRFRQLEVEFARFKNAAILSSMHEWERDARWAHNVIHGGHPAVVLIEISCTRTPEELLGARRAYHDLFHHSLEEDTAQHVKGAIGDLLVRLVSAYRYEGSHVHESTAKAEAKVLADAIKSGKEPIENEEIVRILTTRSTSHLRLAFKHYKETYGRPIEEDLAVDPLLQEVVQCLDSPPKYFSKVLEKSFRDGADEHTKEALTRVIVTRSDSDMKAIKEEYQALCGVSLESSIQQTTNGNFRDLLLALAGGASQ